MKNKIPFFVQVSKKGHINQTRNHKRPEEFPSFVLVQDDTWNDFGFKTDFYLFYYKNKESSALPIGFLKIGCVNEKTEFNTLHTIKSKFFNLSKNFVSISPVSDFYKNIKRVFGDEYKNILSALNDLSLFPELYKIHKNSSVISQSLLRSDEAERKIRTGKYIAEKGSENIYNIKYNFTPNYKNINNESIEVKFDFSEDLLFNRIYGIIGKNGVGKTQLLSDIPKYIVDN